jgi:Zn-dependent metalloprotease
MRPFDSRRVAAVRIALLLLAAAGPSPARAQEQQSAAAIESGATPYAFVFSGSGQTAHGPWRAEVAVSSGRWAPGATVRVDLALQIGAGHLASMAAAGIRADRLCALITAERTFDADGWMRLPSDERMSTLLTPTGLAIEGGIQGAVTNRFGYQFGSPLDAFQFVPASSLAAGSDPETKRAAFAMETDLPPDLPPGLYRLRVDLGVMAGSSRYNLNGYSFGSRPFLPDVGTYFYSNLIIEASGTHVSGRRVNARSIRPRFPWVLLASYNSNGYQGVVAEEDRRRFALSNRSIIPDDVILPLYNDAGARLSYSLEPQFPADTIDALQNIPWNWSSGELSVTITGPDGSRVDLGTAPFVAKSGNGPTTRKTAFTSWQPPMYGRYTVSATGWIADAAGRRYLGGGTYRFWIAKRMTLATATFQGMPYPVGSVYGRDTQFNPAVPADVTVTASLYPDSDPGRVRTMTYAGKATAAGLFGAAQGMKAFPLDEPGEYHAHLLATHTDGEGHLWVSTMRHAGVVYPEPSGVIARGKKILVGSKYVERGDTKFEGHLEANGEGHLHHMAFPYLAGDVLLMAAEGYGTNKIEPVLTYQMPGDTSAWDTALNGVGTTNLRIRTSNGYSPHLYPEYITAMEYYYGAAPRPGFMGRFVVGESNVRAPYWSLSPNSFGGQIGASPNGDAPGDIYRLLGGVVLRHPGQAPLYAGYIASAFLLPRGSNNNRVVAPGAEDLNGPLGERARFYLVGLRPGTSFPVGATFRPALQIDPLLPVAIRFTLTYPDGRQKVAEGVGDRFGSFAGPTAWPLDVPGVYRYLIAAEWNGFQGRMPGLPESGGEFFVYSPTRPAGAVGLRIDGASQRTFSAASGTTITGSTTAAVVHYTLITPGAVIEQGDLPVQGGKFQYAFDPAAVHQKVPLYDITSITTGKPQIGRVIHLTFFSEERAGGSTFFDVSRVILRGTTVIAARPAVVSPLAMSGLPAEPRGLDPGLPGMTRRQAGEVRVRARSGSSLSDWDSWIDAMRRSGELVVLSAESDVMRPGRTHERLQQHYKGIPVVGADITRQSEGGLTVSLFGTVHAGIEIDAVPAVGPQEAGRAAARATGGRIAPGQAAGLVVLPLDDRRYALAWQVETRSATDVRLCYVDAASGRVLLDYSNLKTQLPAGSGHARRVEAVDFGGDAARTADLVGTGIPRSSAREVTASADGSRLAAQSAIEATRQFFVQRTGRFILDGSDPAVQVVVHPAAQDDWGRLGLAYGRYFAGGFWDGRAVVLGAGTPADVRVDGRAWADAAHAADVVAHELAHAVLDRSGGLIYRGESGALAEAFADVVAAGVGATVGADRAMEAGTAHVIGGAVTDGGLRSLSDPGRHGDPDHYSALRTGGGAHTNSTIASHAYYLAVEGGVNRTSGLTVDGVGPAKRDQIERAVLRAFMHMLPAAATFETAREASIQSARDLYGEHSAAARALEQAWSAVGVR